jgi:hypothetical protein
MGREHVANPWYFASFRQRNGADSPALSPVKGVAFEWRRTNGEADPTGGQIEESLEDECRAIIYALEDSAPWL